MSEISKMREKWKRQRLQRKESMPIVVEISPTVTEQQRLDLRFQRLHRDSEAFFNDPFRCTDQYKLMLGLHEGGHAHFARRSGATNIQFHGPTMYWDSRPQYDCPAISKSATSWTRPSSGSIVDHLKADIAGFVCRRELSAFPNDDIAIGMDIAGARSWFHQAVGTGDAAFQAVLQEAEQTILQDLRSPLAVNAIWCEARRFVKEIFPLRN